MRNLSLLDYYRDRSPAVLAHYGNFGDETCGVFRIPSIVDKVSMCVVASSGDGWDHVSVSRHNRCPNWREMCAIKDLFFREEETAMQLHVPKSDYVNNHSYCLHLWRPHDVEIPRPPAMMVGIKEYGNIGP